ncbi:MAG: ATP-binding domain-containing protein [Methylocella sp.]
MIIRKGPQLYAMTGLTPIRNIHISGVHAPDMVAGSPHFPPCKVRSRSLNIELQRALNPRGEPKVEKFGTTFAIGDKVMQIENDYDKEVYNGDIGYVGAIDLELGEMTIAFDGRPVAYAFGELDQIVLAYASTIHKSQGSEFPAVVIPVTTQHYLMLQRNLLYTGVTCGKRLVILLRQKNAVAIAVKNVSGRRRWSKLREWLNPA